jgi:hypothetical protein
MIRAEVKLNLNPNLKRDVLEQASEKIHVPTVEHTTTAIYSSGTSAALGAAWDVMHVVYRRDDGEQSSCVIARDSGGNIIRKTDVFLERWEVVSDPDDLRDFRHCFNERDRLTAEKAAGNAS